MKKINVVSKSNIKSDTYGMLESKKVYEIERTLELAKYMDDGLLVKTDKTPCMTFDELVAQGKNNMIKYLKREKTIKMAMAKVKCDNKADADELAGIIEAKYDIKISELEEVNDK